MEQLETIRSYWNTRADGYSKSVMEEMEDAQKEGTYWKTLLDKYLPKADNPKVLDLGCGPGFFTMMLGQRGCHNPVFEAKYLPSSADTSAFIQMITISLNPLSDAGLLHKVIHLLTKCHYFSVLLFNFI